METETIYIVGLGNPGKIYEKTRHNIGFMVLDQLAESQGVSFSTENKFKAEVCVWRAEQTNHYLIKPQGYMNLSGQSLAQIKSFYKAPTENFWIIHDDFDLPFGTIKATAGGSSSHRGVESISQLIGTQTKRLRVGIANSSLKNPLAAEDFVLGEFNTDEQAKLSAYIQTNTSLILKFIENGFEPGVY